MHCKPPNHSRGEKEDKRQHAKEIKQPESTKTRNRKSPRFSVANVPVASQTAMGTLVSSKNRTKNRTKCRDLSVIAITTFYAAEKSLRIFGPQECLSQYSENNARCEATRRRQRWGGGGNEGANNGGESLEGDSKSKGRPNHDRDHQLWGCPIMHLMPLPKSDVPSKADFMWHQMQPFVWRFLRRLWLWLWLWLGRPKQRQCTEKGTSHPSQAETSHKHWQAGLGRLDPNDDHRQHQMSSFVHWNCSKLPLGQKTLHLKWLRFEWCNVLHRFASNKFSLISMQQCIASCLHSSRPARPELLHQVNSSQFSWCTVLNRVTSIKLQLFLWCM